MDSDERYPPGTAEFIDALIDTAPRFSLAIVVILSTSLLHAGPQWYAKGLRTQGRALTNIQQQISEAKDRPSLHRICTIGAGAVGRPLSLARHLIS
jgi:hypothetical protein